MFCTIFLGLAVADDVAASTSLPPHVDGQVRCFLKVAVNQVLWLLPQPPHVTHVRVQWWGEDGAGTVFRWDQQQNQNESSKAKKKTKIFEEKYQLLSYSL